MLYDTITLLLLLGVYFFVAFTRTKLVWRMFWLGWAGNTALTCAIQDWYGLEAYISKARESWLDVHFFWPLLMFVMAVGLARIAAKQALSALQEHLDEDAKKHDRGNTP